MISPATKARMIARVECLLAKGWRLKSACERIGLRIETYRLARGLHLIRGGRHV